MRGQAVNVQPSPGLSQDEQTENGMWPVVDWDYWKSVNPDVIGWISVPGTNVSQPILQSSPDDPDFYLRRNIHGNFSMWGCIYLDGECEEGLFGSPNAVIYGHRMSDGTMFAELGGYSDQEWARDHATVLLQTPEERRAYQVRFAQVVNNRTLPKRVDFDGKADFDAWYAGSLEDAAMVLDAEEAPVQTVSLVTCSYGLFSDQRTVAVCSGDFEESGSLAVAKRAAALKEVWPEEAARIEAAEAGSAETGNQTASEAPIGSDGRI